MDGVQNPHDEYVNQQWVDLGNMQHHSQHPLSPHHQEFGAHYGFVESPVFSPPDSPFRLQAAPVPIAPHYMGLPQWGQPMPPPSAPVTSANQQYPVPQAIAPGQAPPQLAAAPAINSAANSNPTHATASPRRTLTDADRRRMCIFHEEHPNVKQTEIGAMFGVERSTVSKVLRQKEKYLFPDDGSRSPVKRSKGKFPDIERALSVWVKNVKKQGGALTDAMIRDKARFFATSLGISDSHFKANSASWLEKFKQKNHVQPNGRGRSESDVTGISRGAHPTRSNHSRTESTPNANGGSDGDDNSPTIAKQRGQDSPNDGTESPDSFMDFTGGYTKFQSSGSVSSTPLSGTFTETGDLGPISPTSPFFSADSRTDSSQPSPGFPSQRARIPSGAQARPRSQTFPIMPIDATYISPPPSSEPLTPKTANQAMVPAHTTLASPMTEPLKPLASPHMTPSSSQTANGVATEITPPSKDDAKKALQVVMSYIRQQPVGFVEPDDYVVVGKLLGKFGLDDDALGAGGDTTMDFSNIPP